VMATEDDGIKIVEGWANRHKRTHTLGDLLKTKRAAEEVHRGDSEWEVVEVRETWLEGVTGNGPKWNLGRREVITR